MLRRLVLLSLAAGCFASPAGAARTLLMPSVTYERQVQFTSHGPVAIHVLTAPRPGGLWDLRPVLSNGVIVGRERITAMQRTLSRETTVAGVNGDLFSTTDGRPSGLLVQGGVLAAAPSPDRSSIGITGDGTLRVERIRMFGTWRGSGQRRPLALNFPPGPNGVALFTPTWGQTTPSLPGAAVEAVLAPFPAARPNVELLGRVAEQRQSTGGTPIPPGGAVLVARGTGALRLAAEAAVGTSVTTRLLLSPDWSGVVNALGGGPVLVRGGKPVYRHFELFSTAQVARNPRSAVGQRRDGRILLVAVDGRQPGYSVGMTNFELAQTLVRLGAVAGSGLDGGGSSAMAFDGSLLNRPSDPGGERAVSEGLFVHYWGVYASPPSEPVLSPNADGVGEAQSLAYKVVRPANVTVSLIGPDKVTRQLDAGRKGPGVYRLGFNGLRADGAPEVEGSWRFSVVAVDDSGQSSTADRLFSLNRTLGSLAVSPSALRLPPSGAALRASFTLTRPAAVTASVETVGGTLIAIAGRGSFAPGSASILWNGRVGRRLAHSGRYVLKVTATNEVGRASLTAPFSVRRIATARG